LRARRRTAAPTGKFRPVPRSDSAAARRRQCARGFRRLAQQQAALALGPTERSMSSNMVNVAGTITSVSMVEVMSPLSTGTVTNSGVANPKAS